MRVVFLASKRALVVLVLTGMLLSAFVFDGGVKASPAVPVVLIGEPDAAKDQREAAGGTTGLWEDSGFLAKLVSGGYEPGHTLFMFTPAGMYEDFADGTAVVSRYVSQVLTLTGASHVNVVAYGISGLITRLALEAGLIPGGKVQNLVMVGSPNRGTFLAGIIKSLVEAVRHEAIMEKESRSTRYLPIDWDDLLKALGKKGGKNQEENDYREPVGQTVWSDEVEWIRDRSIQVYEPLYARYVVERYFAVPYVPVQSPKETFAGWICRTQPKLWETLIANGGAPPLKRDLGLDAGLVRMPRTGEDLTLAYYELLAMEVARNRYVTGMASNVSIVKSLFEDPYIPVDWKDALIHYGEKILRHYAGKILMTLKAEIQVAVCSRIVKWTGLASDPDSPFLRRLISEEVLVNLGSSRANRFRRIPANHYLASLNHESSAMAGERTTRYVSVAGKTANLWKVAFSSVGPNDLLTEVDCVVPPLGPRDLMVTFEGVSLSARGFLLKDKRIQDYIIKVLGHPGFGEILYDVSENSVAGPGVSLGASAWAPLYVSARQEASPAEVTFHFPDPPAGWCYGLWLERVPEEGGCVLERMEYVPSGGRYSAVIDEWGVGVRVGIRLCRTGPMNPYSGGGSVGSAFAKEAVGSLVLLVLLREEGELSGPQAGDGETNGSDGIWGGLPVLPQDIFLPVVNWPDQEALEDDGIPMIRVVYRSKRTTLKEPSETYHEYWLLDFGDGLTKMVQGEPKLNVSHVFRAAGKYSVNAISYDGSGKEILRRTWTVLATSDSFERAFECVSIVKPEIDVLLQGPQRWVSGQPAYFHVQIIMDIPPEAEVERVTFDPGQKFKVIWERSGDFLVSAAAVVKLRYRLEDKTVTVTNTYVQTVSVTVMTTGITR